MMEDGNVNAFLSKGVIFTVPLGAEEHLSKRIYLASVIREYLRRLGFCGVFFVFLLL